MGKHERLVCRVVAIGLCAAAGLFCAAGADEAGAPRDRAWRDLTGADPAKSAAAETSLAAMGDPAVAFLMGSLDPNAATIDADRVASLIAQLDEDDFRRREDAQRKLIGLGPGVTASLRKSREAEISLEVAARIDAIIEHFGSQASQADVQIRYVSRILGRIATEKSLAALKRLQTRRVSADVAEWIDQAKFNLAE